MARIRPRGRRATPGSQTLHPQHTHEGAGHPTPIDPPSQPRLLAGSCEFLRLGTYTLTARSPDGDAGATATIAFEDQVAEVSMVLRGAGTVEGVVLDSSGVDPVASALVTLHSRSPFAGGAITRFTEADGCFSRLHCPRYAVYLMAAATAGYRRATNSSTARLAWRRMARKVPRSSSL